MDVREWLREPIRPGASGAGDVDAVPQIARAIFGHAASSQVLTRIGDDDCAVIRLPGGALVATTDLMNHRPALVSLGLSRSYFNYGYVLAAANLSDLYGSGAKPLAMLLGLTVPTTVTTKSIEATLKGVRACCRSHGMEVVGGDTKRGDRFQGYGVALGWTTRPDWLFLRTGVQAGDELFLSGPVGNFNAATCLLSSGQCPEDLASAAYDAVTRPTLAGKLSLFLSANGLAHGGIDISDGLALDVWRLSESSGVQITLEANLIPVGTLARAAAHIFDVDPLGFVFSTAGDWQFAFSCPPEAAEACVQAGAIRIGSAMPGNGCLVHIGDRHVPLPRFGHSDNRGLEFADEIRLGIQQWVEASTR